MNIVGTGNTSSWLLVACMSVLMLITLPPHDFSRKIPFLSHGFGCCQSPPRALVLFRHARQASRIIVVGQAGHRCLVRGALWPGYVQVVASNDRPVVGGGQLPHSTV
ncbi:hypothetical protein V8C86DRAFT_2655357, partial [Haematococcus lacustris]